MDYMFDALLRFNAWFNQDPYWLYTIMKHPVKLQSDLSESFCVCVAIIFHSNVKNKTVGNIRKIHELLNGVDDTARYGSPLNFSGQCPESLLIQAAKEPGQWA